MLSCLKSFTQSYSVKNNNKLDSLYDIVYNKNSHDTSLAGAWLSLSEILYVDGEWENKSYSVTADINWRSGELKTTEMDVFQLVK